MMPPVPLIIGGNIMSKSKSITDLVQELQQENESLKRLEKLANQYTKMEFGYSVKELHSIITKQELYEKRVKDREAVKQGQQITNEHSEI